MFGRAGDPAALERSRTFRKEKRSVCVSDPTLWPNPFAPQPSMPQPMPQPVPPVVGSATPPSQPAEQMSLQAQNDLLMQMLSRNLQQ